MRERDAEVQSLRSPSDALFWATEVDLAGFGEYVFKRLQIIASEDVGWDVDPEDLNRREKVLALRSIELLTRGVPESEIAMEPEALLDRFIAGEELAAIAPPADVIARNAGLSMFPAMQNVMTGIEKTPNVCGGDACIATTRVPVWVLEQARRLGATEGDLLADYPSLAAGDLAAAWTYVRTNRSEIDSAIRDNEEA